MSWTPSSQHGALLTFGDDAEEFVQLVNNLPSVLCGIATLSGAAFPRAGSWPSTMTVIDLNAGEKANVVTVNRSGKNMLAIWNR